VAGAAVEEGLVVVPEQVATTIRHMALTRICRM